MADPNARLPGLLRDVAAAGLRVNNMFHRADGQCQANLRSNAESPICFEWAYGPTFADALEAALLKARGGKSVTPRIPIGVTALPDGVQIDLEEAIAAAPAPVDDLDDILG